MSSRLGLLFAVGAWVLAATAHAQSNCYGTGRGPIMTCFEGGRSVTVRRTFTHRSDGQHYAWDATLNTYCYLNEYRKSRCIQIQAVNLLTCEEGKGGQLICE